MDLIQTFLNFTVPPATFFSLMFFLPPFYFFKSLLSLVRSVFPENLVGKVVIITGASSGIGEHLAYEYAKRGACLALCARREKSLREVAEAARYLGSPDVIAIRADVSNYDDCKRLVDQTIRHFGRLDHLVNNAGIASACMFEDVDNVPDYKPVMDINFWGTVYTTRFAIPHLKDTNGKIVVLSSSASWLPGPRMSFYNASKAALSQFFDTLRVELPEVSITVVTPGFIESELTQGKFLQRGGRLEVDEDLRDVQVNFLPVAKVESCAKAIVNSVSRGQRYLTEPAWYKVSQVVKLLCPEVLEWQYRLLFMASASGGAQDALGKRILDFTGAKELLYSDSIKQAPKTE